MSCHDETFSTADSRSEKEKFPLYRPQALQNSRLHDLLCLQSVHTYMAHEHVDGMKPENKRVTCALNIVQGLNMICQQRPLTLILANTIVHSLDVHLLKTPLLSV